MRSTDATPSAARAIAWLGLLAFSASLIYFVYCYAVVFGRIASGPLDLSAVAINVSLFTLFALHHSVFARDGWRRRIHAVAGSLERSVYVWIASGLFAAVCVLWQPIAGVAWRVDGTVATAALSAAQLFGVWMTLRSAAMIDILDLAGIRQLAGSTAPPTEFVVRGPYGWVRHPIYTGWFLIVFATPTMTMTRLVFAVTSGAYLLLAIPLEERSMRRTPGGSYDRYVQAVRWRLLPGVY